MRNAHLRRSLFAAVLACGAALATAALARAASDHDHDAAIGKPGKASAASRTVEIVLLEFSFQPKSIQVKAGETIRFVIRNKGELLHELNIGTAHMHAEHRKEMLVMAEHGMITATAVNREAMKMDHSKMGMKTRMTHDDPNTALVEPGKTAELVWTFPSAGDLEFACNIPGHYEAGMLGHFRLAR